MSILKKLTMLSIFLVYVTFTLTTSNAKIININSNSSKKDTINVGAVFYNLNDIFIGSLRKELEAIEKENNNKVKFQFFNGEDNPDVENQIIDNLIANNIDLLLLNTPEKKAGMMDQIIYKAKQKSIPVIIFNAPPANLEPVKNYKKSIVIKSNAEQAGLLEGKILINKWNNDKNFVDKNQDNVMQYVMLQGNPISIQTPIRTKTSLETINTAGIKTEEIATVVCKWDKECAKEAIETLFLRYGPKIEVIISNNDAMAVGAVEALQKYGYNTGNKLKTIPVVGIDAIPEAKTLIEKGYMLGTVTQNAKLLAEAIYTVGLNLISGNNPTEGTNYKINEAEAAIILPLEEYTSNP